MGQRMQDGKMEIWFSMEPGFAEEKRLKPQVKGGESSSQFPWFTIVKIER